MRILGNVFFLVRYCFQKVFHLSIQCESRSPSLWNPMILEAMQQVAFWEVIKESMNVGGIMNWCTVLHKSHAIRIVNWDLTLKNGQKISHKNCWYRVQKKTGTDYKNPNNSKLNVDRPCTLAAVLTIVGIFNGIIMEIMSINMSTFLKGCFVSQNCSSFWVCCCATDKKLVVFDFYHNTILKWLNMVWVKLIVIKTT